MQIEAYSQVDKAHNCRLFRVNMDRNGYVHDKVIKVYLYITE